MRKIVLSLACLFLVAGCSSQNKYTTTIENGKEVAVSGTNVSITNQDIYEYLMDGYGANLVLNKALQSIAENYEVDEEKLQTELTTMLSTYKSFYGEDLDTYAQQNLGYDSWEAYQNAVIIPSLRQKMMITDYADNNFETLAQQYNFKKLRIIIVEDESTAISLIADLSSGKTTFEDALQTHSATTPKSDLGVVSDLSSTSSVDPAILNILPQLDVNALYSVPVQLSNNKGYAVVDVVETDIHVLQSEILNILRTADAVTSEAEAYYLAQNKFKVYEKELENNIKAVNPDYIQ